MTEQSHSPTGDDELRHKFAAFVSHATGGRTSDISLPLNTLSVMASQKVNDAWQAALEKGRAEAIATPSPNGVSQSAVERRVKVAILAELMRVEPDAIARELTDEEIGNIARAALSAMPEHQSKEGRSCERPRKDLSRMRI